MQSDQFNQQQGRDEVLKNIDQFRKPYELPHHWQLRKEFLVLNAGKYKLDRLICLSNVFVNVNCLGLGYPDEVMKLVKELGSRVKALETYKLQIEAEEEYDDEPELPRKQVVNNNIRH